MGDVKLAAVMGLYLGRAVAPALLIGFAVGALVGIAMMARRGASARKQAFPSGPSWRWAEWSRCGGETRLSTGI